MSFATPFSLASESCSNSVPPVHAGSRPVSPAGVPGSTTRFFRIRSRRLIDPPRLERAPRQPRLPRTSLLRLADRRSEAILDDHPVVAVRELRGVRVGTRQKLAELGERV